MPSLGTSPALRGAGSMRPVPEVGVRVLEGGHGDPDVDNNQEKALKIVALLVTEEISDCRSINVSMRVKRELRVSVAQIP